ncbi:MAG: hypothetical protein ACRD2J_10005 [Thermoanaerobaculia bacterium]
MPEIDELRQNDRFVVDPPLPATYGSGNVTIGNLGVRGLQTEHAEPLRIGFDAPLVITVPEWPDKVRVRGRVVWSRLSKTPNAQGKYLYRSGVRLDPQTPFPPKALGHLARLGVARHDQRSLERKRQAVLRREQQRAERAAKGAEPDVPPDQALLIQHARDQLRVNPVEAQKWYQRARFSPPVLDGREMPYREDVVAVWEYLGRSVDIEIVARMFTEKK